MSYDKLHSDSVTSRQCSGFTQINNKVINNIKNGDAYLVWSYLYSKSANWKTIKQNIKNKYGFGDLKIKQIFAYLNRCNLIKYVQSTCANGMFAHVQIVILNGSEMDGTQEYIDSAPVGRKHAPAVNRSNGNDELLNKDITKERKEHNTKSLSATDVAHACKDDSFESFWKLYPVKKNKERAQKIWQRKKYGRLIVIILADIMNRIANCSQWADKQYIPHPSTYLNNQLWNDEVTKKHHNKQSTNGGDALSRVINKHLSNKGATYDHATGCAIDPLR